MLFFSLCSIVVYGCIYWELLFISFFGSFLSYVFLSASACFLSVRLSVCLSLSALMCLLFQSIFLFYFLHSFAACAFPSVSFSHPVSRCLCLSLLICVCVRRCVYLCICFSVSLYMSLSVSFSLLMCMSNHLPHLIHFYRLSFTSAHLWLFSSVGTIFSLLFLYHVGYVHLPATFFLPRILSPTSSQISCLRVNYLFVV